MDTKDSSNKINIQFYTTSEIAEMLKMNVQVVARKLQKGEIPGYKIGKDWRVSEQGLWSWLEKHSNQKQSEAEKIVGRYLKSGRFANLPAQRKKRRHILLYILRQFDRNRTYDEKEVNEIILKLHDDFCTVRREFILEKMMTRSGGKYIRNNSYLAR